MTEQEHINQLQQDGWKNVRVLRFEPGKDLGQHTHEEQSVHVILEGEIFVTDEDGTKIYEKGDRIEFPAGTTHSAAVGTESFAMVVGMK
jgi:quercetin dioxygenase-like cupin family protein